MENLPLLVTLNFFGIFFSRFAYLVPIFLQTALMTSLPMLELYEDERRIE